MIMDKIYRIFKNTHIKILLYLGNKKKEVRYSDLLRNVIPNRSSLASALRELQKDMIVERKVEATRPIKTFYSLTELGDKIAQHIMAIQELLKEKAIEE
ncbi:winged helix-turn-helix transcriptional regulator [Candidatus Bathyarchaeota archaeon]|nr:winged helix-turn-helix transcriptional regulator [Candidatus Bathyarchaeota archaeon]